MTIYSHFELKKIPPEKALHLLRKAGYDINQEQSEEINLRQILRNYDWHIHT